MPMRTEFQVGRVWGIPIRVHWTLILFVPLLAFLIASNLESITELPFFDIQVSALESQTGRLLVGLVVAVGLFVSVLLHELGHARVALRHDIGVKAITLWIFGGLAHLEGIKTDPKAEAWISIAGPAVSFALGLMPAAFFLVDPGPLVTFVVGYLAYLNVVLAIFNLLPAFPLDGGRLLRALLAMRMDFGRATDLAADIGKGLAVLLGLGGLLIGQIWFILIAFFIYMGASQEAQGVELFDALDRISVHEIMDHDVTAVDPDSYADELVPLMLKTHRRGFPVVEEHEVVGVVGLTELQEVDENERSLVRIRDVMDTEVQSIGPNEPASQAFRRMMEEDISRLLVVDAGRLVGVVTRSDLMQAFEILQAVPKVEVRGAMREDVDRMDVVEDDRSPYVR